MIEFMRSIPFGWVIGFVLFVLSAIFFILYYDV